jgi:tetratricopeptide (TPR) repeat protein
VADAEAEARALDAAASTASAPEGAEALAGAVAEAAPDPDRPRVVYSAPGLSTDDEPGTPEDDEDEDEDELDDLDEAAASGPEVESHWRHGPPPTESSVPFPLERYPEIIDEFDWEDFGLAIKLGGVEQAGEESVINAFFALWLSVYQDERATEFEPFQHADVVHDRKHRSALLWIDRFTVPATPSDQVGFLVWAVARLNEIVPVAWARFDQSDLASRYRSLDGDDGPPFVLAGNPFAERYRLLGEQAAMSWAVAQSLWDRREIAAMLIELAITHDPDDPAQAAIAERLLLRATDLDGRSEAGGYLSTVMVRQRRFDDALGRVGATRDPQLRLHLVGEAIEHAPDRATDAIALLEPDIAAALPDDELAEAATRIAEHAPHLLADYLARMPARASLVPHLYNASFPVERAQSLAILERVLELPEPSTDDEAGRAAYVMTWNNACIHAHAIGAYDRACELADGAQRFADENPYIYHSAACAYAAAGRLDQALAQVKQAIDHGYDHIEKMEVDRDLGPLLAQPEFKALFANWRNQRADLN